MIVHDDYLASTVGTLAMVKAALARNLLAASDFACCAGGARTRSSGRVVCHRQLHFLGDEVKVALPHRGTNGAHLESLKDKRHERRRKSGRKVFYELTSSS